MDRIPFQKWNRGPVYFQEYVLKICFAPDTVVRFTFTAIIMGIHILEDISEDISWPASTASLDKQAQQLYFQRWFKIDKLPQQLLVIFFLLWLLHHNEHTDVLHSVMIYQLPIKCLCRGFSESPWDTGSNLLHFTLPTQSQKHLQWSCSFLYHLFALLPSGRQYRAFYSYTTILRNSFFSKAIILMNHTDPLALHSPSLKLI